LSEWLTDVWLWLTEYMVGSRECTGPRSS
jgi:hypothetical protein